MESRGNFEEPEVKQKRQIIFVRNEILFKVSNYLYLIYVRSDKLITLHLDDIVLTITVAQFLACINGLSAGSRISLQR